MNKNTGAINGRQAVPLWRQLQSTAFVLMAVRSGESGTAALSRVETNVRPGVQALSFHAWRWLGMAQVLRDLLVKRVPAPQVDALLCVALTLLCCDALAFSDVESSMNVEATDARYDAFTVVDQAVEAIKRNPSIRANSSFINACLRRFLREKSELIQTAMANPVARWNHPQWWIALLQKDHPHHWKNILQSNNTRAPLTLRVNARKMDVTQYLIGLDAIKIGAVKQGKYGINLIKATQVCDIPGFMEGHVSVQDAAAQLAAPLLMQGNELQVDFQVLDACAAPGGKTAHLLEITHAQVTALDIDAARCGKIHETLHRLGLHAKVLVADAGKPETWWYQKSNGVAGEVAMFDAILLDAPCTASGIVRRHPDIRWLRREEDVEQLASVQRNLLTTLWALVKPGGRLLYCTCSVFKAEGANQADTFLLNNKNATLLPSPGHLIAGSLESQPFVSDNALTNHDGFFYALFEKSAQ